MFQTEISNYIRATFVIPLALSVLMMPLHHGYAANPLDASRISVTRAAAQKIWPRFIFHELNIYYSITTMLPGRIPQGDNLSAMNGRRNRTRTTQEALNDLREAITAEQNALKNGDSHFIYKGERIPADRDDLRVRREILDEAKRDLSRLMQSLPDDETRILMRLVSDQTILQKRTEFKLANFDPLEVFDPASVNGQTNAMLLKERFRTKPALRPTSIMLGMSLLAISAAASATESANATASRAYHQTQIETETISESK